MKWSIAIFSSRETVETLSETIAATLAAASEQAILDIIVNGNRQLANAAAKFIDTLQNDGFNAYTRVWFIPVADKSHAWNQYLSDIWPGSDIGYFIDGYVQVMPDALAHIGEGLATAPEALAASGIATMGRSAKALRKERGIHGNLYAIRGDVLRRLRGLCFRLPLGLYRTDPTIGAVLCFGLDPARNNWDINRVLSQPNATWRFRPFRWWSVPDLRTHLKRVMRQAQGALENLAVREHLAVRRKAPQDLPRTAAELVQAWTETYPALAVSTYVRKPLCFIAALKLRRAHQDWSATAKPPHLISERLFTGFTPDGTVSFPPGSAIPS